MHRGKREENMNKTNPPSGGEPPTPPGHARHAADTNGTKSTFSHRLVVSRFLTVVNEAVKGTTPIRSGDNAYLLS